MNEKDVTFTQKVLNACVSPEAYRQQAPLLLRKLRNETTTKEREAEAHDFYLLLRAPTLSQDIKASLLLLLAALLSENHSALVKKIPTNLASLLRAFHNRNDSLETSGQLLDLLSDVISSFEGSSDDQASLTVRESQQLKTLLERFLVALCSGGDPKNLCASLNAYQTAAVQSYRKAESVLRESDGLEQFLKHLELANFVLHCWEVGGGEFDPDAVRARIVGSAPASLNPHLRAAGLITSNASQTPIFKEVQEEFSVVIGGKTYAPRMHSFHKVLTEFYLNSSERYLQQRRAFSHSLTNLALRVGTGDMC